MGGKCPSSGPPSAHSFSPSSVHHTHPKTSPPTPSSSLRNEMSPTTKSPLLGTAPPGFLPPDKSEHAWSAVCNQPVNLTWFFVCFLDLYNATFRPIQMGGGGEYPMLGGDSPNHILGNNNYPTLVPTPIRGPRPPLLATPPGYYGRHTHYHEKNILYSMFTYIQLSDLWIFCERIFDKVCNTLSEYSLHSWIYAHQFYSHI